MADLRHAAKAAINSSSTQRENCLAKWFRRYYPDHWRLLSTEEKLRKAAANPRKWIRKTKNAALNAIRFGPRVKDKHEVSLPRQVAQQLWIEWEYGLSIHDYYSFRLYEPKRWSSLPAYYPQFSRMQFELTERIAPHERIIANDKLKFYDHCKAHDIPAIPTIAVVNETSLTVCDQSLDPPRHSLFVKPIKGIKGRRAALFDYDGQRYLDSEGRRFTWAQLTDILSERARSNGALLIQPALFNHPSWHPFTSGGLATVRLLTARLPYRQEVVPLLAELKMPTGGAIVDNVAAGGITSPIDLETGRMGRAVSNPAFRELEGFSFHPDTGTPLDGRRLPNLPAVLQAGLDGHETFDMAFIGWDIALTEDGIRIVEANVDWGISSYQLTHGMPIGKSRFAEMYDAWMQKTEAAADRTTEPERARRTATQDGSGTDRRVVPR